jgi:hypothetical protein
MFHKPFICKSDRQNDENDLNPDVVSGIFSDTLSLVIKNKLFNHQFNVIYKFIEQVICVSRAT